MFANIRSNIEGCSDVPTSMRVPFNRKRVSYVTPMVSTWTCGGVGGGVGAGRRRRRYAVGILAPATHGGLQFLCVHCLPESAVDGSHPPLCTAEGCVAQVNAQLEP